jgi:hypothetical protein
MDVRAQEWRSISVTPHNRVRRGVVALAIVLTTSAASAAEAAWPKDSASDLSEFVTLLRFRIYADHCSARVPRLKPQFESVLEDLDNHLHAISKDLLASDVFKGMKDQPVPVEIINAFQDSFDDTRHNFERQDAASVCPTLLLNLGEMNIDSLKSDLAQALTAIRTMIRNLEKQALLAND